MSQFIEIVKSEVNDFVAFMVDGSIRKVLGRSPNFGDLIEDCELNSTFDRINRRARIFIPLRLSEKELKFFMGE